MVRSRRCCRAGSKRPAFRWGLSISTANICIIIGVTLALVAFQYWLFERTLLGKKLQATSQDKEMATLLGIPVAGMIMITFVYSAVLGSVEIQDSSLGLFMIQALNGAICSD